MGEVESIEDETPKLYVSVRVEPYRIIIVHSSGSERDSRIFELVGEHLRGDPQVLVGVVELFDSVIPYP